MTQAWSDNDGRRTRKFNCWTRSHGRAEAVQELGDEYEDANPESTQGDVVAPATQKPLLHWEEMFLP